VYEPADTDRQVEFVLATVAQYDDNIFVRGPSLVHVVEEPVIASGELPPVRRIRVVPQATLGEKISRLVIFETSSGRRLRPPREIVEALHARGEWRYLRPLVGLASAPFLRPDGTVCARAGHDFESGILLHPAGGPFPVIPESPTREQAEEALTFLKFDLLGEFECASDEDRAVLLAAYLTPPVRFAMDVCPAFGFDAAAAGSGKTTAERGVAVVADGGLGPVLAIPRDDDAELDKILGAVLARGDRVVPFDNISFALRSDSLCAALTSAEFNFRILGHSETARVPNQAIILLTGNNLALVGDLAQRVLMCRLDPRCEHPDRRQFKVPDFIAHVRALRPKIIAAALTIVRAYLAAGEPTPAGFTPWARFPAFDRLVRRPLVWLDGCDPVATTMRAWRADPDRQELQQLLDAIREAGFAEPFVVADLIERAGALGGAQLRGAMQAVAADGDRLNARRLGKYLAKQAGRIVDDLQLVRHSTKRGVVRWRVADAPQTHETRSHVE